MMAVRHVLHPSGVLEGGATLRCAQAPTTVMAPLDFPAHLAIVVRRC